MFKRRVSYQFGFNGEGEPGELQTIKSEPMRKADVFRALKLLMIDNVDSSCFGALREVRFPTMTPGEVKIDGGIFVKHNVGYFVVPCGITRGGCIEIDVELPKSGKVAIVVMGWAEGVDPS